MAKKVTKTKPRKVAKAPAPTSSTALVLRKADIQRVRSELVSRLVEEGREIAGTPATSQNLGILGEDAAIGMVGQFDIRLTDAEEKVLNEEVNVEDVQIKPTGELYLPHEVYTRWFNRAFGRLGWAIVPAARPRTNSKSVVVPYVLYVHGKPAATAWGEQEYHEDNARQTLGDAVESTVASALRRIAKRLGVGLELWRRSWLERVVHERAVPVMVRVGYGERTKDVQQWRLTNQRPLKGELGLLENLGTRGGGRGRDFDEDEFGRGQRRESRPVAGSDGNGGATISDRQHKRLWAIAGTAGRDSNEVKAWLKGRFTLQHTSDLLRKDYEWVCEQLETPGALPGAGR